MTYKLTFSEVAVKQLKKLDKSVTKKILAYLTDKVAKQRQPDNYGKALKGDLSGLWRYRVGDYRIICDINGKELTILVLRLGHRKHIYD